MNERNSEAPEASQLTAEDTALHLFQIAALMLGDEQEAVSLVEESVAKVEADPCAEGTLAYAEARTLLVRTAVKRMARLYPEAFAVPIAQPADAAPVGLGGQRLRDRTFPRRGGAGRVAGRVLPPLTGADEPSAVAAVARSRVHAASGIGITESREFRRRSIPANAGSPRISARVTGRSRGRTGATSTYHERRSSSGSGRGSEVTRRMPTQARSSPLW